jgi:oxalate decarboxylase/phosphoglucose isomerase-like protein (cupin superfamily)
VKQRPRTAYWQWVEGEGLPIVEGYGIEDVRALPLEPWPKTGGRGTFVQLYGLEGVTGIYVAEIPPGGALEPEKHLYEEVITILDGRGTTQVWQDNGRKQTFEWGRGSVFAPPLNAWHRLMNGSGTEPVRYMGVTNAPIIMDLFHNPDFIFGDDFRFTDRYDGADSYFAEGQNRFQAGRFNSTYWETNFIPDLERARVDPREQKGYGTKITAFEISGNSLVGHISDWPVGRYHKAHYHGPGAVLLILRSTGYVLIWPKESGVRPYQSGRGDDVVKFDWKPGSIYAPPTGWFHQHLNTGPEPALQLAVRYGSRRHLVEFDLSLRRAEDGVMTSIREGGTLIEYEDEDPQIRQDFDAALRANGIESQMPAIRYESDLLTV